MILSFKTELNLNDKQKTLGAKHAGVARHANNWDRHWTTKDKQ